MRNKEKYDFNKCRIAYNNARERYEIIYANILFTLPYELKHDDVLALLEWLERVENEKSTKYLQP